MADFARLVAIQFVVSIWVNLTFSGLGRKFVFLARQVQPTQHHRRLPNTGQLSLGQFDLYLDGLLFSILFMARCGASPQSRQHLNFRHDQSHLRFFLCTLVCKVSLVD